MIRSLAALLTLLAGCAGSAALAQQTAPTQPSALNQILNQEVSPEKLALAMQVVKLSGTSRTFDELLPNIADQAKNAFIRANPQMQLGIIQVVDTAVLTLVSRRPELDRILARIWASSFTDEELQSIVDFYSSEAGKKFADVQPRLLAVEMAAAQEWSRSVSMELTEKVSDQLKATMAAEQEALQGSTPAPAPAPAPAQ
jgi:hypothetical protein